MAQRTGIPTIIQLARKLCILVTTFAPIIRRVTNNDPAVQTALDAVQAACSALEISLELYRETGS